ncbi:MAG TPA: MHYT domain-containing protein [Gammaproteobacteria bacterium]|jgi:NO-binding membrane sensor protein with MHYT domain|nr:MHYT domain-containing protein [Gammaproteobacteria bacterium]
MFSNYFQGSPLPSDLLVGAYDINLIILSFLVATAASYIALDLTGRLRDMNNTPLQTKLWLLGGAIAMGSGIWSMHFIGMLSFTIPGLTLEYDFFWTALSLLVAIVASGFALSLLKSSSVHLKHYIAGGVILGLAVASMHYTGMEAMLISLNIRYLPGLFFISILIAIIASEAAIWLALKSNSVILRLRRRIKMFSAIIMGAAICGMHYTGMAASIFTPLCATPILNTAPLHQAIEPTLLAMGIAAITLVILAIAFFASSYKDSLNQQAYEQARQLGMAEISSSVLHNVGNIITSACVSSNLVIEAMAASKLNELKNCCDLLNQHKSNLADFLTKDPRGPKLIEFLSLLTKHLQEEQATISSEIHRLNKNLNMITEIISTQQHLSKKNRMEEIYLINDLIEDAMYITGIHLKKEITLTHDFGKIKPITIDKGKIIEVFVNLLNNAKDSVILSPKTDKRIAIKTSLLNKNTVRIEISDNGVGIAPDHLNRIFNYGFTTKKDGHGFGLHTSAISVNQLGGTMSVTSEGLEKGATFIIDLSLM